LDWSGLGMASWPASQYETAAWPCSQPEGGRGTLGGGGRAGPRLLQARLQAPVGLQRSEHVRMVGLLQRKARREVPLSVTVQRSYSPCMHYFADGLAGQRGVPRLGRRLCIAPGARRAGAGSGPHGSPPPAATAARRTQQCHPAPVQQRSATGLCFGSAMCAAHDTVTRALVSHSAAGSAHRYVTCAAGAHALQARCASVSHKARTVWKCPCLSMKHVRGIPARPPGPAAPRQRRRCPTRLGEQRCPRCWSPRRCRSRSWLD